MVDRFNHLFIAPSDFEASVAFYRDVLGWRVTRTWGGDATPRGAALSGGGVEVVLVEAGRDKPAGPRMHLDIHDVDARFRALPPGTHVVTPPSATPWGTRWFVVRDPDGNLIAFEELRPRGG